MDRRALLKYAAAWSLCPAIGPSAAGTPKSRPRRRVRPTDPHWPDEQAWDRLRLEVGGKLIVPAPFLGDCISSPGSGGCLEDLKHLRNPYYIGDQPSGTQVSGWLNAWSPATSAYAVRCQSSADAIAAVNFARDRNLRLVVKGGGHSYQGTSNAPDSLLLWTRAMRSIAVHDEFVGRGCESTMAPVPAVTVEAGAVWMDVYDAVTTQSGRYVQGGGCATVGVAGLVQSGGFGSFSKRFGTAAAGLLQAEIVTADGILRTINRCSDPDLFWAVKGGGGGNWGVLTRVTLRTQPLPQQLGAAWGNVKARNHASFRRLIGRFMDFYAQSLFNPTWGESVAIGPDDTLKISMVSQGVDTAAARLIWREFFDWIRSSAEEFELVEEPGAGSRPAREWWDMDARRKRGSTSVVFDDRPGAPAAHGWWSGDQDQVGAFLHGYDSVWLPASLLRESARESLADALFAASRSAAVELHFNKGLAGAPADAIESSRDTATNPAVLDAFALAIVANGGAPRYPGLPNAAADDATAHRDAASVDRAMQPLLKIAPSAGSYVSESNYFNRRWGRAFWGSNLARLRDVKRRYDPDGLFFTHHGVGSEDWSADGFIRLT